MTDSRRSEDSAHSYCRSCDGYSADVGKLDNQGWCERCSYRNALQAIVEGKCWQAADTARVVLKDWES